ncbi:MAG: class I SAM-dependent methyltransferase [Candidatus Magasanikbacteria bacterium]|nr:class I SAM-dependent methyltransferase [Candidatus Magasanikbacteria bacterium]
MPDFFDPQFSSHIYKENPEIFLCWPSDMNDLAKAEAEHHDHDHEDPFEVHQLESWRNRFYHRRIWKLLQKMPVSSRILEVGAGSGFDAKELLGRNYELVLGDVSPETLNRLSQRLGLLSDERVYYVALDAEHLPFLSNSFEAMYMIATFHHVESPIAALAEAERVLKPDGLLILGVEPNLTYFRPIRWFKGILYRLSHTDPEHISKADAQMEGFSKSQLDLLFKGKEWKDLSIRPMWFIAGFFHYVMEFMFRALKLSKRLRLPLWFEKFLVRLDEFLFKIPGFSYLAWHWVLTARKRES